MKFYVIKKYIAYGGEEIVTITQNHNKAVEFCEKLNEAKEPDEAYFVSELTDILEKFPEAVNQKLFNVCRSERYDYPGVFKTNTCFEKPKRKYITVEIVPGINYLNRVENVGNVEKFGDKEASAFYYGYMVDVFAENASTATKKGVELINGYLLTE